MRLSLAPGKGEGIVKQPTKSGVARLKAAWGHSCNGLVDVWRREEAFRLEVFLFAASFPAAAMLASSVVQGALMIGSVLLLMIVEVINSAIEATIDRIGLEHHELSRVAKDLGSAAVLLTALIPAGVWAAIVLSNLEIFGA